MRKAFKYIQPIPLGIKVALVFVLPISEYLTTALIKYPFILTVFIVALLITVSEIARQSMK